MIVVYVQKFYGASASSIASSKNGMELLLCSGLDDHSRFVIIIIIIIIIIIGDDIVIINFESISMYISDYVGKRIVENKVFFTRRKCIRIIVIIIIIIIIVLFWFP